MAFRFSLAFLPVLVGCTMDIGPSPETQKLTLSLQRQSSAPGNTLRDIAPEQLLAGDLLFSSSLGLTSLGIRLFSTSSVSHVAVYIGDGQVAEAVGDGVQIVTLDDVLRHSDKLFALRLADLTPEQAQSITRFAHSKNGSRYNYGGIAEMVPFMLTKQLCSLNPFSRDFRQQCIQGLASAQLSTVNGQTKNSYFCSEFVTAAYASAGRPLTHGESSWVSPSDLMHMRVGDVASLAPEQSLIYVGHLKQGIYLKARKLARLGR
ncbi:MULTISPECIES: YaeF family permuted papain-like enzyme [Tenebrionibacter/Tenebrionicola group]|jgi:cell wall-associated NlpC family hydrolase|uniref:YaeF family permuted papain-like enzyme n=2 Tax=Tenebrionibacter/Tenebrionicola group TaxID=2969848 RepID=A0A8K0XY14_9ENTR|nr:MULTISPECIES: YaeF family permuted papain-like enzyme [Tenebrionibacter/Tenebrionicola group]MBK4714064.1 YaeF family permuted papain-like enzyme [Tenebrionibacter intestinalis]MBV5094459.1 YaeF family permuted papain-like enzyme [Tenebrionicola larvae]